MSKRRPSQVFRVIVGPRDDSVYVVARHEKGALSVARAHGHEPFRRDGKFYVRCVPGTLRSRCINGGDAP